MDGEELQGSSPPHVGRTYLLAAYAYQSGYVLGQLAIGSRENESSTAPPLLAWLNLQGQVVTGDTMFTQVKLCAQIVAQGGGYLFVVKDNQPWQATSRGSPHAAHQPRPERLSGLAVCGAAMVEREWWDRRGRSHYQGGYLITSLASASAAKLLAYKRGHWQIEDVLHYVRAATMGEDHSQARKGRPAVVAAMRNTTIGLLRRTGETNIVAALRRNLIHPQRAFALVGVQVLRKGLTEHLQH